MTPPNEELYVRLAAQGLVYGFLSKVFFSAPSREFVDKLVAQDLFTDWPLPADNTNVQMGLELLRSFCAGWDATQITDLTHDYYRLFIGPEKLLAPPWESVYLSNDHLIFDKQTIEVRQVYARFGLKAPHQNVEPDDHIGLELAFFVHLCSLGLNAIEQEHPADLEDVLSAQREFLSAHLLKWAPECMRRVIDHANSDYYRGAAKLLVGCLALSASFLNLPAEVLA